MSKWTEKLPEAARDWIAGRRVDEVECIIGDIAGVARGKAMPAILDEVEQLATVWAASGTGCLFYGLLG